VVDELIDTQKIFASIMIPRKRLLRRLQGSPPPQRQQKRLKLRAFRSLCPGLLNLHPHRSRSTPPRLKPIASLALAQAPARVAQS